MTPHGLYDDGVDKNSNTVLQGGARDLSDTASTFSLSFVVWNAPATLPELLCNGLSPISTTVRSELRVEQCHMSASRKAAFLDL